jgi:hypothetical protein
MDSIPLLPRLMNGFVAPQNPATTISQAAVAAKITQMY